MKLEFPADNQRLGKILYALAHCPLSPEFSIENTVADPEQCKNDIDITDTVNVVWLLKKYDINTM